jgi:hypothetical protein
MIRNVESVSDLLSGETEFIPDTAAGGDVAALPQVLDLLLCGVPAGSQEDFEMESQYSTLKTRSTAVVDPGSTIMSRDL